jgi:hypothetical protein
MEMSLHSQGCSYRWPCCIEVAFVPETAYEPAAIHARGLSYSSVHKRRMCVFQVSFATLNPRRCATADDLCQHIQPPTAESHRALTHVK